MGLVSCPDCGNSVSDAAPACPKCGRPFPGDRMLAGGIKIRTRGGEQVLVDEEREKPGTSARDQKAGSAGNVVAGVASFFVPGLGQLVQGRFGAGLLHFVIAVFLWFVFLGWVLHLYSAWNAATWQGPGEG